MPNLSFDPTTALTVACTAAQAAGRQLTRKLRRPRTVQAKGWRNIVTDADFAAQQAALGPITAQFPEHLILAEEGDHAVELLGPQPVWIVDPLDGTTNYARQFPNFSVAIALAQHGQLQVGVTYDPLRQQLFYAVCGQGAYVQEKKSQPRPIRASATPDLASALVGVDWAREPAMRAQVLAALGRIAPQCRTVRALGSSALALAYVAAGWLDAYFNLSAQVWDVAAGALLITEAGGQVTTPTGAPWALTHLSLAAANPHIHSQLLQTLTGEDSSSKPQDSNL